jgi:hypothetical protein
MAAPANDGSVSLPVSDRAHTRPSGAGGVRTGLPVSVVG